ncbi:hypothetical protein [Oceanicaulis sp.]|uniref:hypothetical protein n=1 Tax=Oceanicaulis sp. TaxID=1924941 RepID=UPI003D28664C
MRYLPYWVGGFMLLPFVLWAGLFMAFPGDKPGITDAPLTASLVAVSVPLVLFHYIAGLGFVANSMSGQAGEVLPVWGPARWVQRAMAPLTLIVSVLAVAFLKQSGEGWITALAVGLGGLVMAGVMVAARRPTRSAVLHVRPGEWLDSAVMGLGRALLHVPVLGGLLREAGRDPHRGVPLLLLNLALLLGVLVALFGFTVLVIPALLALPFVFYALLVLASG